MVAGEASGDIHGALLARELKALVPGARISGIGGPAMAAQGVELLYRAEELSLVGFSEVLPKLGRILGVLRGMRRHLAEEKPALLILIDFPDFNFRLGAKARRLGVKVLYYVCPQVWAWRQGRARKMARFTNRLAATYPFEPDFLADVAPELPVSFVGHPLLDQAREDAGDSAGPLPVPRDAVLVGLLPGSRATEIRHILPTLLGAARLMSARRPGLHFLLPIAPGLTYETIEPFLQNAPTGLTVLRGRTAQVMAEARLLLAASGTATLQAALAGTPMVVVYKTGVFNYLMARALVKVEFIAMPNLVAGRRVVPELIQGAANPEATARAGLELIDDGPAREAMSSGLARVQSEMGGPGASRRVAELARELILDEDDG
jgi:lipid-A-disaccharide synthase